MHKFSFVPDVIEKSPEKILAMSFEDKQVNLGNIFTPTEVKNAPQITWEADPSDYYTLLMVDNDPPVAFRQVRHWLVVNIKGSDITTGQNITEFLSSGPPKNHGMHKYLFLLYKQPKQIEFDIPKTSAKSRCHRYKFNTNEFAKKYNLGDPIAGNFYQAEWDLYVEEKNKNFKICDCLLKDCLSKNLQKEFFTYFPNLE